MLMNINLITTFTVFFIFVGLIGYAEEIQQPKEYSSESEILFGMASDPFYEQTVYDRDSFFDSLTSDLSKIQLIVETNKNSYKTGEQVEVRFFIKNTSEETITVHRSLFRRGFAIHSLRLTQVFRNMERTKEKEELVPMTLYGQRTLRNPYEDMTSKTYWGEEYQLKPSEKVQIDNTFNVLNIFFDITMSGTYRLTVYRKSYNAEDVGVSKAPKPYTIEFEVGSYYTP
jgi:hypothetical protein